MKQTLFQYYEIRAAVDFGDHVVSYFGDGTPEGALHDAAQFGPVFWTIYGIDQGGMSQAIGDFDSFEKALEVLQAILAPFRDATTSQIEDILNQSSNDERLLP